MGQQQVILLILVSIIVGISFVVAVNTMQKSHESANMDAIRQTILASHAMAQAYYRKPTMLGGGGNSFRGITYQDLRLSEVTEDGNFDLVIEEGDGQNFRIRVLPRFDAPPIIATISLDNITWEQEE